MWGFFLLSLPINVRKAAFVWTSQKEMLLSAPGATENTGINSIKDPDSHSQGSIRSEHACARVSLFLCVHLQHDTSFKHFFICHYFIGKLIFVRVSQKTTITMQHTHTQILQHTVSPLMSLGKDISRAPSSFPIQTCQNIHLLSECIISYRQEMKSKKKGERREPLP